MAVLLGIASLGSRNTGGKLESPEIRLCWVRNGVAPGAGAQVPSPNTLRVFQAVFERKILELKTNVVRILNFDFKIHHIQAYLKLSSYAKAQTAEVGGGCGAQGVPPLLGINRALAMAKDLDLDLSGNGLVHILAIINKWTRKKSNADGERNGAKGAQGKGKVKKRKGGKKKKAGDVPTGIKVTGVKTTVGKPTIVRKEEL